MNFDFDHCKFPKNEEEVLSPDELLKDYHERRNKLTAEIEERLTTIQKSILDADNDTDTPNLGDPWKELSLLTASLPDRLRQSVLYHAIQGKLIPQNDNENAEDFLKVIRKGKEELVKQKILKKKDLDINPISDEEIPYDIPENWRWVRFEDIAMGITGKTPERGNSNYWASPKYPWVSISDMNDWSHLTTTKEGISEKAASIMRDISPKGSLIMSFKLTVGRTSILDIDAYHNEAIITVKPFADKDNYLRDYLFTFLPLITQSGDSKDAIKGRTLNAKSIAALLIPLPPLEEMHRIVDKLSKVLPKIDSGKFQL